MGYENAARMPLVTLSSGKTLSPMQHATRCFLLSDPTAEHKATRYLRVTRCHAANSEATHTGVAVHGVGQGWVGSVKHVDSIADFSVQRRGSL